MRAGRSCSRAPGVRSGSVPASWPRRSHSRRPTPRGDVVRFVWELNRLALVNVDRTTSRLQRPLDWLWLAVRLAPVGALPAPISRRRALDTRTVGDAVSSCAAGRCCPGSILVTAVATVLAVHFALIVGARSSSAARRARHGTWSRAPRGRARGAPAGRSERARRAWRADARSSCGRRPDRGERSSPWAGRWPSRRSGWRSSSEASLTMVPDMAFAGCPFAAHALALTVVGGDGRVACGL